jgi:hypothetical protein
MSMMAKKLTLYLCFTLFLSLELKYHFGRKKEGEQQQRQEKSKVERESSNLRYVTTNNERYRPSFKPRVNEQQQQQQQQQQRRRRYVTAKARSASFSFFSLLHFIRPFVRALTHAKKEEERERERESESRGKLCATERRRKGEREI